MRWVPFLLRLAFVSGSFTASLGSASFALAQEVPRVAVARTLSVGGIAIDPHIEDLLGLGRIKFQGLIASELSSVGYRVEAPGERRASPAGETPPLNLVGLVREETCDDQAPSQCRIAIQWELQDARGVVVYRTTTRAVEQSPTLEKQRRGLLVGALRSLLLRRRFALQLSEPPSAAKADPGALLGFKQCRRAAIVLPQAERSVAASVVLVESGSNLTLGVIVSPDGMILTAAPPLDEHAPLRVRFSAAQTLPAEVARLDRASGLALLRVDARTEATCAPLRERAVAAGTPVFGVGSEPSEDRGTSLSGSFIQKVLDAHGQHLLVVDARVARGQGGPLFDDEGSLVGVVLAQPATEVPSEAAAALDTADVLHALKLKTAAITDPRLRDDQNRSSLPVGYVRDPDDPSFVLSKRYTYGTSPLAHGVRTAAWATAGTGAFGVVMTWSLFRTSHDPTPAEHNRLVIYNDLSWILLATGAAGVIVSFALPEGHDVVGAGIQSATRRGLSVELGGGGVNVRGNL